MAKNALTHFKDIAYKSLQLYISRMTCQIGNIALNQEVPIFPEGSRHAQQRVSRRDRKVFEPEVNSLKMTDTLEVTKQAVSRTSNKFNKLDLASRTR
jgi:hypothetical protein